MNNTDKPKEFYTTDCFRLVPIDTITSNQKNKLIDELIKSGVEAGLLVIHDSGIVLKNRYYTIEEVEKILTITCKYLVSMNWVFVHRSFDDALYQPNSRAKVVKYTYNKGVLEKYHQHIIWVPSKTLVNHNSN